MLETFGDLDADGALAVDLLSKEVAGGDALPAEMIGQEESILLSERPWWSKEEDAMN